ncbi:guanylate kinase [Zooshikella harenae]|uniref:Guanylate kinase n=2 Tax=Zooshikella harenae TaxID=2827238 RepID=A0ABS5ZDH0_9GAMM|nr:guanylate kinase [Zooshikella harenae]
MNTQGSLYIISAPSGAGKSSLVAALVKSVAQICVSVSYTTRAKRPGEEDGVNYNFITQAEFQQMLTDGAFLEQAEVFGNYYGTSEQWVNAQLANGTDVILEIDWQGAQQIRRLRPDAICIFIVPPSRETLLERLNTRGQDNDEVITKRMAEAEREMAHFVEYDYLIINDEFSQALSELETIVKSQRLKVDKQQLKHEQLLQKLLS